MPGSPIKAVEGIIGATSGHGIAVLGRNDASGTSAIGVSGTSTNGTGAKGFASFAGGYGVVGVHEATTGTPLGILGQTSSATDLAAGVKGETLGGGASAAGVYSSSPTGFGLLGIGEVGLVSVGSSLAGYFGGDVYISGTLSKSAGSFRIDHPLEPATKYLQHSFVESPDMMNVYNGNVRTDRRGFATVRLPRYFSALNRDFRYQLMPIRSFARTMVAREIAGNRFTIRTDKPFVKVSWQVTGIRKDAHANANRIRPEIDKGAVGAATLRPGVRRVLRSRSAR